MERLARMRLPSGLRARAADTYMGAGRVAGGARERGAPVWDERIRPALATVTGGGRTVLVVGIAAWALAAVFGWVELAVVAMACLLLLAAAAAFMIGRTKLEVRAVVEPPRVTVGEALTGELSIRNLAKGPLAAAQLEFPIGEGGVSFDLPPMLPGRSHSEIFSITTQRRGVIVVGPVRSVRGDPMGLFRRELDWTRPTEVFVHPRVTPIAPLGAGLIRDLEGNTAQSVSTSDFSFQALREYVPGDDLRHVHWRSSARHGRMLVRQFLDTRRSHLTAIVDGMADAYQSEDDYETAISVAASLITRALRDGYDVSFLSGDVVMTKATGRIALDACSRAQPSFRAMVDVAADAARLAPETSVVFLITGPGGDYRGLERAATQFGVETGRVAIRVDSTARPGLRANVDLPVLTITRLDELPGALNWGLA
jgi:uncharacterized protein (DUF58 family)